MPIRISPLEYAINTITSWYRVDVGDSIVNVVHETSDETAEAEPETQNMESETIVNDAHKTSDEIAEPETENIESDPMANDAHDINDEIAEPEAESIASESESMADDVDAPPVPTARPPETRFAERPKFRGILPKLPLRCKAGKAYPVPPPPKLNRWGVPIMEKLVPWDPLVEVARSKPMFFKCPSKEPCVLYKTTVPDHLRGQMSQQQPGKKNHCHVVRKQLLLTEVLTNTAK